MLLLTAVDTETEQIVDDYLETVRLGDQLSTVRGIENPEPEVEAFCRTLGTTTEGAFRAALDGLDLPSVLAAGGMSQAEQLALRSWRGTIPVVPLA